MEMSIAIDIPIFHPASLYQHCIRKLDNAKRHVLQVLQSSAEMRIKMNNPRYNSEGYDDPTAYHAMKEVMKAKFERDKKASELIKALKSMIHLCGFELTERIGLKDLKSGKEFK